MNYKIKIFLVLFLALFTLSLSSISPTYADQPVEMSKNLGDAFNGNLDTVAGNAGYVTNNGKTLIDIIGKVINIFISFMGIIFLGLMIYGGYLWMADKGNSENIEKAKKLFTAAIIGLIITYSAYAITWYVIKKLGENSLNL